jgi:hypothetical protein
VRTWNNYKKSPFEGPLKKVKKQLAEDRDFKKKGEGS